MSSRIKSLFKDTVIYGATTMLSRFLGWALFPLYVYQLPSPADYGIVTNLYAWVALLLILLTYGMETGFFRFSREGDGRKVYANSLRTLGTSSLLFLILGLLFVKPIGAALGYADMLRPVAMLIVIVAIDAFTSIPFAYLRYTNQALRYGLIKIGYVLLTVALNLFFLLVCPWLQRVAPGAVDWWYEPGLGVEYIFLSNMIANIILLLVLIPYMKQARGGGRFDWGLLRRMLHYSLPMVLLGIAGNFNKMADKIIFPMLFEDQTFANTQLGIYSAGYKIAVVIVMFTQAFRFAYEPFIFQRGKEGELSADEEAAAERERRITYAKAMHYYLLSAIFIYVAVMCYLDLLKVLISPAYYDGLRVVPFVMLGEVLFGIYYNLSLWYKLTDRTYWGGIISTAGCLLTVAIIVWGAPHWGFMACAYASVVSNLLLVLVSYFLGRKYYPVPYQLGATAGYFVVGAITVGLVLWIYSAIPAMWMRLLLSTVVLVALTGYIVWREHLVKAFAPILRRLRHKAAR